MVESAWFSPILALIAWFCLGPATWLFHCTQPFHFYYFVFVPQFLMAFFRQTFLPSKCKWELLVQCAIKLWLVTKFVWLFNMHDLVWFLVWKIGAFNFNALFGIDQPSVIANVNFHQEKHRFQWLNNEIFV